MHTYIGLDAFLRNQSRVCTRCFVRYSEDGNFEGACKYHAHAGKTLGSRTSNSAQEVVFPVCMYVYVCICMYMYVYVCICMYVCIYVFMYAYVCMYVCM
jgi:hypothetical protein